MSIIIGIICLILLCSSILVLSSFPISIYKKNNPVIKEANKKVKDYYGILFDVYNENTNYKD